MTEVLFIAICIVGGLLGGLINLLCSKLSPAYNVLCSIVLLIAIGLFGVYMTMNLLIVASFFGGYCGSLTHFFLGDRK